MAHNPYTDKICTIRFLVIKPNAVKYILIFITLRTLSADCNRYTSTNDIVICLSLRPYFMIIHNLSI